MIRIELANTEQLQKKAFDLRYDVFVVEQKVSREEEFDEFEETSRHFVALDDQENPVGAARWRKTSNGIKLERFAVAKNQRGQHIGSKLVEAVLNDVSREEGSGKSLYLHAQLPAVPLYEKYGFQKEGDQFEECNIMHYKMIKTS